MVADSARGSNNRTAKQRARDARGINRFARQREDWKEELVSGGDGLRGKFGQQDKTRHDQEGRVRRRDIVYWLRVMGLIGNPSPPATWTLFPPSIYSLALTDLVRALPPSGAAFHTAG
jgi:hypothetical protein